MSLQFLGSYSLFGHISPMSLLHTSHVGPGGNDHSLDEPLLFEPDLSDVRVVYGFHGSSLGFVLQ